MIAVSFMHSLQEYKASFKPVILPSFGFSLVPLRFKFIDPQCSQTSPDGFSLSCRSSTAIRRSRSGTFLANSRTSFHSYDELVKAQQELIELERSVKDARALVDSKLAALNVTSINANK